MDNLKTGDLLLIAETTTGLFNFFLSLIKWGTRSPFTHIAMIIKDLSFIHPTLKGTFVWESSWEGKPDPQDGKVKLGVQITPLQEFLDSYKKKATVILRKIINKNNNNCFSNEILSQIHSVVYDKPYDFMPLDWINALLQRDNNPQKTDRFWCSALIGYIYTKCGILDPNTDWSILRPSDFSLSSEHLSFMDGYKLSDTEVKIL